MTQYGVAYGFITVVYTQTDPPGATPDRRRIALRITIALFSYLNRLVRTTRPISLRMSRYFGIRELGVGTEVNTGLVH